VRENSERSSLQRQTDGPHSGGFARGTRGPSELETPGDSGPCEFLPVATKKPAHHRIRAAVTISDPERLLSARMTGSPE
jgi:hypothetical protein